MFFQKYITVLKYVKDILKALIFLNQYESERDKGQ